MEQIEYKNSIQTTKIKDLLPMVKDNIPISEKEGVYEIPCTCAKPYIGQTRKSLKTKLKEHICKMHDAKEDKFTTSGIAVHLHNLGHTIKFEDIKL